jgi:RNA-directed DNA polymerase
LGGVTYGGMAKVCAVSYEEAVSLENLCAAWKEFVVGKRGKSDVSSFARHLGDEIVTLHEDLASGCYRHGHYERFSVADPKPRIIHKALIRDRLVHRAVHRLVYPFFSRIFIADSFSCQLGKGTHRAIERFRRFAWRESQNHTHTCWVLKGDIRKFFASIDHGIMIDILRRRVVDRRLVALAEVIIRSHEARPGKGLPLGNLTSQLFANIYLNEFDRFVKMTLGASCFVRYADDFVILSDNQEQLVAWLQAIHHFLKNRLALEIHPNKVNIKTIASGVDFLGWVHFPHHRVPRTTTRRRAMKRVIKDTGHDVVQSYLGLFKHGDSFELRRNLVNATWIAAN